MDILTAQATAQEEETSPPCAHCGNSCAEGAIKRGTHWFCCQGCELVYDLLQANGLDSYYQIEQRPGTSRRGATSADYSFLDDPTLRSQLINYEDDHTVRLNLLLPQIHCSSCIWLLENLYKLLPDVQQVRVNLPHRSAFIAFDPGQLSLRQLVEMLDRIGYPPQLQLAQLTDEHTSTADRGLHYRLGVAGFAFGNIMLLSFPEYFGLEETYFARIFGYLNLLLALPVIFYSASEYWRTAFWGLRQRHLSIDVPITLGILALFGRSAYEILSQTGAGYLDSLAGLVFFLLVGKWFQQRTYDHLSFDRDYTAYFPIAVRVKDQTGGMTTIPLDQLRVGDTIIVRGEELLPADGILLEGKARIDYSFVTGEAEPVSRQVGETLYAGGKQLGGQLSIQITKAVKQSYLTELWNNQAFNEAEATQSQLSDQTGRVFTYAILSIALATFLYWVPQDVGKAVNACTSVLIIACPCAIALAIPFTYGNMLRWLGRASVYLKNISTIEGLQRVDTIVFDKTGTLTNTQASQIQYSGQTLSEAEKSWAKSLAALSSHPLSRGLTDYLSAHPSLEVQEFIEQTGVGLSGVIEGRVIRLGHPDFVGCSALVDQKSSVVGLSIDGVYRGLFNFQQPIRAGVEELFHALQTHYRLSLLSGDNEREAERFTALFGGRQQLHFQQLPQDKLDYIQSLQQQGRKVLMIGDGLNDAGALKQSDVGLVVTEDTNNFTPACDGLLLASQLHRLSDILRYAHWGKRIICGTYTVAILYNLVGLSFAVTASLSPVVAAILMPLSSITIVALGVSCSTILSARLQYHDENHPHT